LGWRQDEPDGAMDQRIDRMMGLRLNEPVDMWHVDGWKDGRLFPVQMD